jgi:hypothetical protein
MIIAYEQLHDKTQYKKKTNLNKCCHFESKVLIKPIKFLQAFVGNRF